MRSVRPNSSRCPLLALDDVDDGNGDNDGNGNGNGGDDANFNSSQSLLDRSRYSRSGVCRESSAKRSAAAMNFRSCSFDGGDWMSDKRIWTTDE